MLDNHALHLSIFFAVTFLLLAALLILYLRKRHVAVIEAQCAAKITEISAQIEQFKAQLQADDAERQRDAERLRSLIDRAQDGIVILDADSGKFVDEANPAIEKVYGVPRDELLGHYGPIDLSPEFQPDGRPSSEAAIDYIKQAVAGGFPVFEWLHTDVNGTDVPCRIALSHFPHPTRNLIRASVVDLTEQKKAEAERHTLERQLAHAQRVESIGQMTGGIAHDFNNLLVVIQSNTELLMDDLYGNPQQAEMLDDIGNAARKGAELVRLMLSFARKAELTPEVVNVNDVVAETQRWTSRTVPANIKIDTVLRSCVWPTKVDPNGLQSSIINILVNARDAMPEGGDLTIETQNEEIHENYVDEFGEEVKAGRYVVLTITDTGPGIPKDKLRRVFDPFYTTKAVGQGTGLGLSMVQGFVRQSGGMARVTSTPGKGTSFRLYFPASDESERNLQELLERKNRTINGNGRRILVVDDQDEVLSTLVRVLTKRGYDVMAASSGDAALRIFENDQNFDLLLSDVAMPGSLQGPALASALRLINPDLPVVFLTGYAAEANLQGHEMRKTDKRLMKPVASAELLEALSGALHDTDNH